MKIPNTGKEVRFKIFRNIGNAFVRLGQFQDAIPSYETIMGGNPDFQTGFNLILCYLALGDGDKMKKAFSKLLSIPIEVTTTRR
jgi:intraflagellar transport protein 88